MNITDMATILTRKVFRNPDVMWREEEDAVAEVNEVLDNGDSAEEIGTSILFTEGLMMSLNVLGTEIWKLAEGLTMNDIVMRLHADFEVDIDVLIQDVAIFLEDLSKKGFIHYE